MKKTIFTITAIGILGVLACSNKKDPEPAPKSKMELLTSHEWIRNSMKLNGIEKIKDCEKDDIFKFNADSTFVGKSGNIKCDENETVDYLKWRFIEEGKKIETLENGVHGNTLEIIQLDEVVFKFKEEDGYEYTLVK